MIYTTARAAALLLALIFSFPSLAQDDGVGLPSPADLKTAREAVEANSELSEERRTALLDTLGRIDTQLKKLDDERSQDAAYRKALDSGVNESKVLREQLEKDIAAAEGKTFSVPGELGLEAVEQQLQGARTDLKTLEDKSSRVAARLKTEADRPDRARKELAETQALLEEVRNRSIVTEGLSAAAVKAEEWQQAAQIKALEATVSRLENELLSRPARMDMLRVEQDRTAFELRLLRERIKAFEQRMIALRQEQAQQALSEVASTQQAVADAHPAIQELAQANTVLSAEITARTASLDELKQRETLSTEQAVRFEQDLESIKRKLAVLGMTEALGKILREQQQRLPSPLFGRGDIAKRDRLISEASLNQLAYEDERRALQSLGDYVDKRLEGLPEAEAQDIRPDMIELARTRRQLINTALDVETTYLRSLGDLDFAIRRVESAATSYRDFISERLLWLRSSPAFSLETLKPLPGELMSLLSPTAWLTVAAAVPSALLGSVLYPALMLIFVLLLRYHRRLLELLAKTGDDVGNVAKDRFGVTLEGLGLTALIAVTWPLFVYTLGIALDSVGFEGRFEKSVGSSLERISLFFLGLEFARYLLVPQGLLRRHFNWAESTVKRTARKLWQLEILFVPSALAAMIANRSTEQQGTSVLSAVAMMVALIAMSRFFMQTPSLAQGELSRMISVRSARRRSLVGRLARYLVTALPLVLVACILLGYVHTAIQFLSSLVGTLGLFAGLVLLHELGVRWLKILRLRLIERERQAALEAARAQAENPDQEQEIKADFDEPDPNDLDSEGRNLLNTALILIAIVGTWGVWSEVLPALGILNSIELWSTTRLVDGVETASPVTPLDIIQVLLITFAGYVAVQRLPSLLDLFLRQQMELASGTVYASVTLVRYVLITVFVIVVLGMLGADWSQIQWAVAALSVGIGFGLQEIVANFISGIILLFEQPIRVGDIVTVGDTSGTVTKIRMRATTVRDWDGRELLVPNKEFITGRLLNWSLSDQQTRVLVEVGVAYGSDVPKAMKLALDVAKAHPEILADPEPSITFDAFGDNSLLLTLRCYLPSLDRRLLIASELRNTINDKYNEAGIVIAFPQRDVHLNAVGPLDINIRSMKDLAAE